MAPFGAARVSKRLFVEPNLAAGELVYCPVSFPGFHLPFGVRLRFDADRVEQPRFAARRLKCGDGLPVYFLAHSVNLLFQSTLLEEVQRVGPRDSGKERGNIRRLQVRQLI